MNVYEHKRKYMNIMRKIREFWDQRSNGPFSPPLPHRIVRWTSGGTVPHICSYTFVYVRICFVYVPICFVYVRICLVYVRIRSYLFVYENI